MSELSKYCEPRAECNDIPQIDTLSAYGRQFQEQGVVILENFIPDELIEAYTSRFKSSLFKEQWPQGFGIGTPYKTVVEIKDLCLYRPLMDVLNNLFEGDHEMAMHLNLTGWRSTERNWHQDDYLNPPFVNAHYAGVWFALDDIDPDSGPFEYVEGSHNVLDICRRKKVLSALPSELASSPDWPWHAESILNSLYDDEIERLGLPVRKWCGKKGDVLIWHGWLLHRGSKPNNPELYRPTIITHYSSIKKRPDMPPTVNYLYSETNSKGKYFNF
jgi:hypothetical protein